MYKKPIEVYPLSYSQKSIWLSCNFIQQKNLYHLAAKITFTISLDPKIIKKAVYDIINTYPQLRAHFCLQKGEPVQLIHPEADTIFTMEKADNVTEEELEKKIRDVVSLPFDLEKGPLIRVHLFCCSVSKYIFIGCIHHIITDGWALNLIFNEIINHVLISIGQSTKTIHTSQLTYKDFIDKQNDFLKGSKGENILNYWKQELGNKIEPVKFPYNTKREASHLWEGSVQRFTLRDELFSIINYSPFCILLSIIYLFLYRLTAQKEIYIAIPMLNRMNRDFMNVIGNFTNTVIIKADFTKPLNFLELLSQVNDKIKKAQLNQMYPFLLLK
ncbi:MAG: hypothetical protein JXJ04_24080, partial [Spirochaetales bacterium]|nr:hypothetical protein [Spirochaetales bacterium]